MSWKTMRLLVIGFVGAIMVMVVVHWGGDAKTQPANLSGGAAAISLSGRGDPETTYRQADASVMAPVTSSLSEPPEQASRPDAGYYDHPGRPYGVAGNLFFTFILHESELDTHAAIDKIVEVTKVDRDTAWKFLEYIRKAKDDLQQYQASAIDRMCAQRDGITTIPQLAAALEKTDAEVESHRAQLTRRSESILGAGGMRNFEMYIASKDRGKKPFVPNNEARLREMNKRPPEVLSRLCDIPKPVTG